MKRIYTLIIFIAIVCQTNAQWTWQNPLPQGNDLNFVKFYNDEIGWAVGNDGTIIKTTDGGDNWTIQNSTTKQDLSFIFCLDQNIVFALGNQVLLKTTDGGVRWNKLKISDSTSYYTLYFINENTGWLSINKVVGPGESVQKIIKTTDGGLTWNVQFERSFWPIYSFSFTSENEGWALVSLGFENRIFHTADGETWEEISTIPNNGSKIQFVTKDTGYVTTSYFLYKTIDGGKNWESSKLFNGILSSEIISESTYLILDSGRYLQITTDGGNSWIKKQISFNDTLISYFSSYNSIDYKKGKVWTIGKMGTILKSDNLGDTWNCKSKNLALELKNVQFITKDIGWAVGQLNTILKTNDGGTNWFRMMLADNFGTNIEHFIKVCFLNENLGWVASNIGNIYKTTDGGSNWLKIKVADTPLSDIFFISENVGWTTTDNGIIHKTTDGGLSWVNQEQLKAGIYSIYFINDNLGWITFVGLEENFGMTTDGGETWNLGKIGDNIYLTSIYFFDKDTGWAASTMRFARTTDGGKNWQLSSFDQIMNSIFFVNKNIGWAAGEYGVIMKTTDGGISWNHLPLENSLPIKSIYFISENEGWIVGANGMIMRTTNGGTTFVQDDNSNEHFIAAKEFRLGQNYPNPFNPSTKINYQIPQAGFVTLKVYDPLGREVTMLVNEEKAAGNYEVNFNADKLSSGVYFYKLQTGNYIKTRKMVLIK